MFKKTDIPHPPSHEDNTKRFLEEFPMKEIWRFFVEQKRYDFRIKLYETLYRMLNGLTREVPINVDIATIENSVREIRVKEVCRMARETNNTELLHHFETLFKEKDKRELLITDIFNKHQGWRGFEEFEPGYLSSVMDGFNFILKSLLNETPFDLEFIVLLHKTCTRNVKNMLEGHYPGELRNDDVCWICTKENDSIEGLTETIDYIKSIEISEQLTGFFFDLSNKKTKKTDTITQFKDKNSFELAEIIWNAINNEKMEVAMGIDEDKKIDLKAFLTTICNKHLENFHHKMAEAKTKEQKLNAIFTYLKYTVLHHPFQDGVGRTYSMLLPQYLFMRENLLPGLLFDSNIIPGYSVKELVGVYLDAEKEMEKIFKNKHYISSDDFCKHNIDTNKLLENITLDEKNYFLMCVSKFESAAKNFLELKYKKIDNKFSR